MLTWLAETDSIPKLLADLSVILCTFASCTAAMRAAAYFRYIVPILVSKRLGRYPDLIAIRSLLRMFLSAPAAELTSASISSSQSHSGIQSIGSSSLIHFRIRFVSSVL